MVILLAPVRFLSIGQAVEFLRPPSVHVAKQLRTQIERLVAAGGDLNTLRYERIGPVYKLHMDLISDTHGKEIKH